MKFSPLLCTSFLTSISLRQNFSELQWKTMLQIISRWKPFAWLTNLWSVCNSKVSCIKAFIFKPVVCTHKQHSCVVPGSPTNQGERIRVKSTEWTSCDVQWVDIKQSHEIRHPVSVKKWRREEELFWISDDTYYFQPYFVKKRNGFNLKFVYVCVCVSMLLDLNAKYKIQSTNFQLS